MNCLNQKSAWKSASLFPWRPEKAGLALWLNVQAHKHTSWAKHDKLWFCSRVLCHIKWHLTGMEQTYAHQNKETGAELGQAERPVLSGGGDPGEPGSFLWVWCFEIFIGRSVTGSAQQFNSNYIPKNLQQSFGDAVKMMEWGKILSSHNIDGNCDLFMAKINETVSLFSRIGHHRPRKEYHLPGLDQNCRALMKSRGLLLKQCLKTGLSTDRQRFTHACNKLTQTLRKAKAIFFMNIMTQKVRQKSMGNLEKKY